MLVEEILRTCANRQVADAAVLSLGTTFAGEVKRAADARAMTRGEFTAQTVLGFARDGDEAQMREIISIMQGSQQPLLDGLRHILSMALDLETITTDRHLGREIGHSRSRLILGMH